MSYLQYFREIPYPFNGSTQVKFQDISQYADIIDSIKDEITAYTEYYVLEGDRPDNLSQKLYGTPDYYWTFHLMNDHIRESGWVLSQQDLNSYLDEEYDGAVLKTKDMFYGELDPNENVSGPIASVGTLLTGSLSNQQGYVIGLDPENGQIFVKCKYDGCNDRWQNGEAVTWLDDDGQLQNIELVSGTSRKYAIEYYEDAEGNRVDVDSSVGAGALLSEVTTYDVYSRRNEELRRIKVIKPEYIKDVVKSIQKSLQG